MNWRVKPLEQIIEGAGRRSLHRSLGAFQLTMLGIGAIIGTGIFVLTAVGAERAGPGLMLSFVIAGTVCGFAALAYSELASMVPVAGSAYTYSYAVLGEAIAWLVGWCLILEYAVAAAAVAVGWSGYAVGFLESVGMGLPQALSVGPHAGGVINLPAVFITVVVSGLLILGTRESAFVNALLVAIKVIALIAFIVLAGPHIDPANFKPFMPMGFSGVMGAAALIFFAYVGFDAVSTAAEETKDPNRNVPIGLIASLVVCTLFYVLVTAGAVGALPWQQLVGSPEPLAHVLRVLGYTSVAQLVGVAAIVAMPTVILMMLFGQTRIFFVMARDRMLPDMFAKVHPKFKTPHIVTMITCVFVAGVAGFFRVDEIAELSNTGTLFAFASVSLGVVILRITQPDRHRPFRCPSVWFVGPASVIGCVYLFISLPIHTIERFFIWVAIGAVVYLLYGFRRSPLRMGASAAEGA
ncbi:MAG TPA: amino acid permease [Pedomonas sp.]|nr:amino acid permease [Pedomonas sp.]